LQVKGKAGSPLMCIALHQQRFFFSVWRSDPIALVQASQSNIATTAFMRSAECCAWHLAELDRRQRLNGWLVQLMRQINQKTKEKYAICTQLHDL
jgi:hypothetical protein